MSKDKTAGNGLDDSTDDKEQFVAVEVDDSGRPLNQATPNTDDETDDSDIDEPSESDDDERLGHEEDEDDGTRAGETLEQKRERRRRESRAKRIRNRVAADSKDRLIDNQGKLLLNLQEQVAQLQGRTVQYDVNLLTSQLAQIEAQQSDAKVVFARLSNAKDGEGMAEVVELQFNLRDQHRQISEQLRRAKTQQDGRRSTNNQDNDGGTGRRPIGASSRPAADPEIVRQAQTWAGQYEFMDPKTGDPEEIGIVRVVDQTLSQEGWDPRSPDYWRELTVRVRRRLPHHFKKTTPNGGGDGRARVSDNGGSRPAQGGPRMAPASQSGSSRLLGRNEVRVTPARKKAMQEAGMWEDPKKRTRMLARYAEHDRAEAE